VSTPTSKYPYAGSTAAVIGGGVIGASWAALFLVNRLNVVISDPDPDIESKVKDVIDAALPALADLGYEIGDIEANLSFEPDNATAVAAADLVQECAPERLEFKQALWQTIEAAAPADALLCSSSSTLPASAQNTLMTDRSRLLIGHPFNPPHLMPLVEVVPTPLTNPELTTRAVAFYNGVGKVAMPLKKEITGFVANRLQAAIFQESIHLVTEGVVTLDQLDNVVTSSLGIRWATCGPFLSFHLGGGPGGLTHFMEHLGPPLEVMWQNLGKASFDEPTKALLNAQLAPSYAAVPYDTLSELRDAEEVAVISALNEVPGLDERDSH
jgi:ketoreductase RED1